MVVIKSKDNDKIKLLVKLSSKKWRDKLNLFVIEGERAIQQAIDNNTDINILLISEIHVNNEKFSNIIEFAKEKVYIDSKLFDEISDTSSSQGIIAIANTPHSTIDEIINDDNSRILLIDKVQDPGNLGTIIRTAEAAGYDGILCVKGTVDAYSQKVTRSTVGANTSIKIAYINEDDINKIKTRGFKLISTSLDKDSIDYRSDIYNKKVAIVVGNEGEGVSEYILNNSDYKITIPLWGKVESLNVAVATAIIIYESRHKEGL